MADTRREAGEVLVAPPHHLEGSHELTRLVLQFEDLHHLAGEDLEALTLLGVELAGAGGEGAEGPEREAGLGHERHRRVGADVRDVPVHERVVHEAGVEGGVGEGGDGRGGEHLGAHGIVT